MQANDEIFAEQLKLAKSLFNQGKYVETQEACENLHATQPENVSLIILWSASLLKQGEYDKSLSCLDKVPETHNKCTEVMMNKAAIYFGKKNYPEAEKLYHSVLSQKPDFVECNISYIYTLIKMEKNQTAIEALDNVIKLHPKLVEPYILYGQILFELNRTVEAESKFKDATKLEPESFDAWEGLGDCYVFNKQFENAIKSYEKASEIQKLSMHAFANLGFMHYKIHRYHESIAIYNTAIQTYPELKLNKFVMYTIGKIYLSRLNDVEAAEPYYKSCVDLDENNIKYNRSLLDIYGELEKWELAFLTALKCAGLYILIKDYDKANFTLEIAEELKPANYYADWQLARLYNKLPVP